MANPQLVTFTASLKGLWQIESCTVLIGAGLSVASRLNVSVGADTEVQSQVKWVLRGKPSNIRYTHRLEVEVLKSRQAGLHRAEATCAALIPIRKTQAWWDLAQDERRTIMEEQSRHISIGMEYLPAIARQLLHCRDLGEPFDFLTWFEYAPEHADAFDTLLDRLRASREWAFVEREVDIRLRRAG